MQAARHHGAAEPFRQLLRRGVVPGGFDFVDVNAVAEALGGDVPRQPLRRRRRILRRPVADLVQRLAEAVRADDQHRALRVFRDYRLVRASLEQPVYKEKLRMRSYGQVFPEEQVFLELKKKYRGIVYKRRIELAEDCARAYMDGSAPLPYHSQIGREIDYFRRFYSDLEPAVYLCYDRSAWFAAEDPNLRATFDRNIRWRQEDLSLTAVPGGEALLPPHQSLFEIKTAGAIPLWLVDALDRAGARKASFSKYGAAYKLFTKERTGVCCA